MEVTNNSKREVQLQKKCLAEQLWLYYFNTNLYEKGLITETQRNRIGNMIGMRNMRTD